MRVDFMNPVQQAMMSIAHFGTAMYAKNKADEHERSENEYRKKRLELQERGVATEEQRVANRAKQLRIKEQLTDAEIKVLYAQNDLTPKGNQRRPRKSKPKSPEEAYIDTQVTGSNTRNAVEYMRSPEHFESGEIDLSSLGRK